MSKEMDLKKLKVLLIEDQADNRAMTRNMLSEFGVTQVFEAADGQEGIGFTDMAMDMVNFIICDWNMPNMDGIDVLKQIRTVDKDMPFLMVTGRGDMGSVFSARDAGVSGYIKKPFSPAQLEAKIRIIMQKKIEAAREKALAKAFE